MLVGHWFHPNHLLNDPRLPSSWLFANSNRHNQFEPFAIPENLDAPALLQRRSPRHSKSTKQIVALRRTIAYFKIEIWKASATVLYSDSIGPERAVTREVGCKHSIQIPISWQADGWDGMAGVSEMK
jgi:hypothetical protein